MTTEPSIELTQEELRDFIAKLKDGRYDMRIWTRDDVQRPGGAYFKFAGRHIVIWPNESSDT